MEAKLKSLVHKLQNDERGLSTVEYVVLLVLIVAMAVALWNMFGTTLTSKLIAATKAFDTVVVTKQSETNDVGGVNEGETYKDPRGGEE